MFRFCEKINLHKKFGVIKVTHNIYDNIIYTAGYDNHIICYNTKNQQKIFDILSSNTKAHISTLFLNNSNYFGNSISRRYIIFI